jgi:5-hydroxyisourate hydrolase
VSLELELESGRWQRIGEGTTDTDGRVASLGGAVELAHKTVRLHFETGAYFSREHCPVFYPFVDVTFVTDEAQARYHVPLLLSPFGYSTYRGS